jgi:hypothetical protein
MNRPEQLIEHTRQAIINALNNQSKISDEVIAIHGMSSTKGRHMLNNICSLEGINYLEVGVWKGSTAISALYQNNIKNYTVIENWKICPKDVQQALFNNFNSILGHKPNIIQEDCFSFNPLERGIKDIDIYFYDGEHEEIDQYQALTHYYDSLADHFVFIVDDTNYPPALVGTIKAILDKNLKIEAHWTLQAIHNSDHDNFWNGMYVAVLSKQK